MNSQLLYSYLLVPLIYRNVSYEELKTMTRSLCNKDLLIKMIKLYKVDKVYRLEREAEERELLRQKELEELEKKKLHFEYQERKVAYEETNSVPWDQDLDEFIKQNLLKIIPGKKDDPVKLK
jgi:hypothetical protein